MWKSFSSLFSLCRGNVQTCVHDLGNTLFTLLYTITIIHYFNHQQHKGMSFICPNIILFFPLMKCFRFFCIYLSTPMWMTGLDEVGMVMLAWPLCWNAISFYYNIYIFLTIFVVKFDNGSSWFRTFTLQNYNWEGLNIPFQSSMRRLRLQICLSTNHTALQMLSHCSRWTMSRCR